MCLGVTRPASAAILHGLRLSGRVVMQRPAKPCTPVRFRPQPPIPADVSDPADCSLPWASQDAPSRPGGEIGRRKGLKIPRLRSCGFESRPGHHLGSRLSPERIPRPLAPCSSCCSRRWRRTSHRYLFARRALWGTLASLRRHRTGYSNTEARMVSIETFELTCPWCGSRVEVSVECTGVGHEYVEDCWTCCRPMVVRVRMDSGASESVEVSVDREGG